MLEWSLHNKQQPDICFHSQHSGQIVSLFWLEVQINEKKAALYTLNSLLFWKQEKGG